MPILTHNRAAGAATSPFADVTATSPDLLVPLKYASTSADGQILYEDSGLTTPVDADGDPIGGVRYDGATICTQSTDAARPIFDDPGADGDGSNDWMDFNNPGSPHLPETADFGLFFAVEFYSSGSLVTTFAQYIGAAGNGRFILRQAADGTFAVFLGDDTTSGLGTETFASTSTSTDGTRRLVGLIRTGNAWSLRVDGAEEATLSEASQRHILQTGNTIFARNGGGTGNYDDNMVAFNSDTLLLGGVYRRTLSASEIDDIESAFADLTGITL